MRVGFLPEAQAELLKEVLHYSAAREGLGVQFQAAVEAAVQRAVHMPSAGMPGEHGTRSRLVKGFPFSVVYRVGELELLIVAIAHHRRRPGYWASRS